MVKFLSFCLIFIFLSISSKSLLCLKIYALAQLAIFGWQFSVLTQCQHVVMAQSNLQCEYYCPCVGASTARTSAIIEGY